jgi:hypothetical protein
MTSLVRCVDQLDDLADVSGHERARVAQELEHGLALRPSDAADDGDARANGMDGAPDVRRRFRRQLRLQFAQLMGERLGDGIVVVDQRIQRRVREVIYPVLRDGSDPVADALPDGIEKSEVAILKGHEASLGENEAHLARPDAAVLFDHRYARHDHVVVRVDVRLGPLREVDRVLENQRGEPEDVAHPASPICRPRPPGTASPGSTCRASATRRSSADLALDDLAGAVPDHANARAW